MIKKFFKFYGCWLEPRPEWKNPIHPIDAVLIGVVSIGILLVLYFWK